MKLPSVVVLAFVFVAACGAPESAPPADLEALVDEARQLDLDGRHRLEKAFGLEIDRRSVKAPSAEERFNRGCGCIYYGLAEGMHAEVPTIHWDDPPDFLTAVVYLSDGPASAGTAWYRHKPTGLYACPTKADAVNHGYDDNAAGLCQFKDDIDADTPMLSLWEMQGFAALKPGRAVLYRSGMFHRATEHFGACKMDGRLYWTLRFAEKR